VLDLIAACGTCPDPVAVASGPADATPQGQAAAAGGAGAGTAVDEVLVELHPFGPRFARADAREMPTAQAHRQTAREMPMSLHVRCARGGERLCHCTCSACTLGVCSARGGERLCHCACAAREAARDYVAARVQRARRRETMSLRVCSVHAGRVQRGSGATLHVACGM
jgi:hypothetical protein